MRCVTKLAHSAVHNPNVSNDQFDKTPHCVSRNSVKILGITTTNVLAKIKDL